MKRTLCSLACALGMCLVVACQKGTPPPDKPQSYDGELVLTPPALEGFIKVYFASKAKGQDRMVVHDQDSNADLKLKLESVHAQDPAPETSPGHYYICAEMTDEAGASFDVDFLYKKTSRGIEVSDVLIHKSKDTTRYEWVKDQAGRFWVREPKA